MSKSVTSKATFRLIESYLSSLDCPRSLAVWIMFRENEHDQLAKLDFIPDHYDTFETFRLSYLATKFLSKADFLFTTYNRKEVAYNSFLEAESECKKINDRGFSPRTFVGSMSEWLHNATKRKIESILRDFDGDEMIDSADWGPGATLKIKGIDTSSASKFRSENETTRPLDDLMGDLYAVAYPIWNLSNRKIVIGNKVVTVPKNSKTDRTIAIEPGLNIWFQKGVGKMIRRRLRRVGVDLDDQSRNQQLARLGSLSGELATVDFSAASDTISKRLVEELLPPTWWLVMASLRSPFGTFHNSFFRYEKFSSMGNGFTFELETLIFLSIALACCEKLHVDSSKVSVYGDDVIIPVEAYDLYVSTCAYYGFTVNRQKSYYSGHFRESCGSHWWNGKNCKPFFLKEEIIVELDYYKTANGIRRLACNRESGYCDKRFFRPWSFLRKQVDKPCLISDGYGDGGFIVNFDEAAPTKAKNYIEGYRTQFVASVPICYSSDSHSVLLARLKARSIDMAFGNKVNVRRRVKISRKRLFIRRWENLGPWL